MRKHEISKNVIMACGIRQAKNACLRTDAASKRWMLNAVQRAAGRELRKGPRGGGRDIEKILDHVLEADQGYLARLAWKHKRGGGENPVEELSRTRGAILNALEVVVKGDLPEQGPRGGITWPGRYFVRRVAWHVLDHAWEIDDRIV